MTEVLILFPHQLLRSNLTLTRGKTVLLVENALHFREYSFHKQKLVHGGLITTKPYISGSSYLRKMSNFPRGAWCDTCTARERNGFWLLWTPTDDPLLVGELALDRLRLLQVLT